MLGRDGPFHRERTEPLGETKVPHLLKMDTALTMPSQSCNVGSNWSGEADILPGMSASLKRARANVMRSSLDTLQIGPEEVELVDMPSGAGMKDCVFRAHDPRFCEIIGENPQIVRLAQKDYEFAHEVRMHWPQSRR